MHNIRVPKLFFFAAATLLFSTALMAQSQTIVSSDFEKGTQNWEPRGPASISSSKDIAASGSKSLRVSGRREFWQGAQLNVTKFLKAGKTYKFSVAVRMAKDEKPDDVKLTMQRGDNDFEGIGGISASADAWTTISGRFRASGRDQYLLVYVESARPTASFYLDDFSISPAGDEIPAQSGVLLTNDFEDMTAQNWYVNGDGVQMFSSNAGGSQSIKISGRTLSWQGPVLDVSPLIFKGRTYKFSVSLRLVKGQAEDTMTMKIKQTPAKGEATYVEIAPMTKVTDAGWVTLSGEYSASTADNNLLVYVESTGPTTAFYLDNFSISVAQK